MSTLEENVFDGTENKVVGNITFAEIESLLEEAEELYRKDTDSPTYMQLFNPNSLEKKLRRAKSEIESGGDLRSDVEIEDLEVALTLFVRKKDIASRVRSILVENYPEEDLFAA